MFSHLPLLQSSSLYSIALLLFSFPSACLSPFKLFPMCPRTITKPACLFMFHWGITLFLCYYFFCVVASVWLAPDSATLSHPHYIFTLRFPRTQNAHTFPHTPNALCVSFVYASLGSMEIHLHVGFFFCTCVCIGKCNNLFFFWCFYHSRLPCRLFNHDSFPVCLLLSSGTVITTKTLHYRHKTLVSRLKFGYLLKLDKLWYILIANQT